MGKASRTKQAPDRRARIAAQREAERRAQQRKRIYLAGGSILAVVIVVLAFVLINANSSAGSGSNGPTGAALTTLTKQVTGIPVSTQDKVGGGNIASANFITASQIQAASQSNGGAYFATVNGKPLTSGGKPEVVYIGAEYCPYCAAQRWSMIVALSRFGTFTGLTTIHSSSTDVYPNTPSWTFYGSKYTSKYITFTPVEETKEESNQPLQTPTAAQEALIQQYDPTGGIPFIDIGNKYVQVANLPNYGPTALKGKNWTQIATAMSQPTSAIAQGALGSANYMTAAICTLTNNQPSTACTPAIQALQSKFAS